MSGAGNVGFSDQPEGREKILSLDFVRHDHSGFCLASDEALGAVLDLLPGPGSDSMRSGASPLGQVRGTA